MKKTLFACLLAIGFAVVGADTAWAQPETFMLVPGIPGGSLNDQHKGWIDVMSITQTLDTNGKRGSACGLQVVKSLDVAGPPLWAAAVTGQVFPEIRVEVLRPGEMQILFYEIKLGNARVSTIATTVGTAVAETLTLAAETATLTFFTQTEKGTQGPATTATVSCR